MRKLLLLLSLFPTILFAQFYDPVHWETHYTADSIYLTAYIESGWHLYANTLPDDGPKPTTFIIGEQTLTPVVSEPHWLYDENFEMQLPYYVDTIVFSFPRPHTAQPMQGRVEYMACSGFLCISPTTYEFTVPPLSETSNQSESMWWIFLMGLLGGLLAIFTPCVWPIIPMTVSFFIKKNDKHAISNALLYGLSIIIIYLTLGIIVTLIFGADALNNIATNAIVNIFFFLLLVIFAISFFGAFEITLPSSWSTRLDNRSQQTSGILSILLMAFTLVIVSFSCTGPIIGTLLVEAAGRSFLAPAIGMFGFALALALPFTLFAIFPKWLSQLPKSGSWMTSFKIVLAFLELALSLKFLSVADLAYGWHILDRETFIALWIVIFALLGLYLLGVFRFKHEFPSEGISITRLLLAIASLAFSIYMLPGLWGAPLKAVSAFAPPIYTQDFILSSQPATSLEPSTTNDVENLIDETLSVARAESKNLLIDFSGYGCVNCRKMEAKVLSDPRVEQALADYIVLTLMVDDRQKLPRPITVSENNKSHTLKTVGDYWSYYQRTFFAANAQPFYVKLSPDGTQIGTSYSYNDDVDDFLLWLGNTKK